MQKRREMNLRENISSSAMRRQITTDEARQMAIQTVTDAEARRERAALVEATRSPRMWWAIGWARAALRRTMPRRPNPSHFDDFEVAEKRRIAAFERCKANTKDEGRRTLDPENTTDPL